MSNHHNHPSHIHNFLNKHTAFAILLLIIGCFAAGYYLGKLDAYRPDCTNRFSDGYLCMKKSSEGRPNFMMRIKNSVEKGDYFPQ